MAIAPSMVLAQSKNGFLGRGNTGVVIAANAGKYEMLDKNQAALEEQLLKRLDSSRQQDLLYVKQTQSELRELFHQVQQNELVGLQKLQNLSMTEPVEYPVYIESTRAYINKRVEINTAIGLLTKLPSAVKNANNSAGSGSANVQLPNQLQLDFTEILKSYNESLDTMDQQAQALTFRMHLLNGSIKDVAGINAEGINKSDLISQQVLDAETQKIGYAQAHVYDAAAKNIVNQMTKLDLNVLSGYINDQGKTERWRLNNSKDPVNSDEIKSIIEVFWLRSYVRATYGMGVGGIAIQYKKMGLGLDAMFAPSNIEFVPNLSGTAQLNQFRNLMAAAVKTYDGASEFGGNPLNMAKYVITRVKGNWNNAEANAFVVRLLVADLEEENLFNSGNGLRSMRGLVTVPILCKSNISKNSEPPTRARVVAMHGAMSGSQKQILHVECTQ